MTIKDYIIGAIAVIALVFAVVGGNSQPVTDLGASGTRFPNGISTDSTSPTTGQIRGATFSLSGAASLASTLSVTDDVTFDSTTYFMDASANANGFGTTTPRDLVHVENQSATSTLIISTKAGSKGGRLILEDHDGAGCSEISILNGTVAAKTVTCPTGI